MHKDEPDQLLRELRHAIERSPSDLKIRFDLAKRLCYLKRFKEAVPELQKARQNPTYRKDAMELLSAAFRVRRHLDSSTQVDQQISDESVDDDEDDDTDTGSTSTGAPAPLRPNTPTTGSAANQLPIDTENET